MRPMSLEKALQQIDEELARLQMIRGLLEGKGLNKNGKPKPERKPRQLSEAGRRSISLAMKRKWRAVRKAGKNSLA